jgi:hypothetical protein
LVSLPGAAAHQLGITTGSPWYDMAIEALVWLPYYVLFTASAWQATPGKRVFGIKVTDLDGGRISMGRSFARCVASFLSGLSLGVGFLMAIFTKRRQALHDFIAGTLVVNAGMQPGVLPADHQVMPLPGRVAAGAAGCLFLFMAYTTATAFLLETPTDTVYAAAEPAGPATGPSHQLRYALYKLPFFGGDQVLVTEGTRSYRLADVRVVPGPGGESESFVKRLEVVDGFAVEAHIYREPAISGFGLSLEKGLGFSWEWFDLEGGYVFSKRQGPGRIQVRLDTQDGREEIAEILFLEDVTLRVDRNFMVPFTRSATEHLVVKKGSVLALK